MDAKLVVAVDSTQVKKADDDLNKLAATAAKVESEISDLGAAGAAAAKGMSAMGGAAGGSVQQLAQAERIMQRAGLTAGQYSQAMRQLPVQLTDVVTSLASGMPVWMVAIQQGGQVRDSFGGIGNAARAVASAVPPVALGLTAVGAAAVTAAVGLAKGEAETAAFNRAIILTGNAAGTTADQLRGMAIALGGSATEGAAAAALAEIAATGKIAADQIQAVATAALSMEQTTGKAVSDTVKEFVRLADEPAAASAKLNEQYNYLTTSVYEQIKALEDQGRTTEAAKLATDTYAEAIRERSGQVIENLGYVESAWNAIVGVTKRATDAIREFGRDQTISDQIADIDAKLTDAYNSMATAYSDADKAATQGYINRLNAQKTALQLSQNEANLQAGIDSLRAERTKQEIADAQARDRALSGITNSLDAQLQSAQRLTVEERTRQQLTKAGVDLDSEAAKTQLEKARQVDAASAAAKAAAEAEREGEKAKRAAAAADKKRAEEIQRVLDTLLPMEAAERKHAEQLAVLDSLVRSGDLSWQEYQVAVQNAWATLNKVEFDKAAQEMRKGEQEAKRLAAELQSIEDRLDPLGAAARKYQQEQAKLNAAIAKGGPEADKYRTMLTKLEAEYAENQRSATAWGKLTESALERVDSAFADAWMNIGDGFKGFRDSLTNAFKQMLAELAHMAITKPIVLSLGAALGIGGSSQALASGGSGIFGLLGGSGGGGGGLLDIFNAGKTAYGVGTSGFGQAIAAGWNGGQGFFGGLQGAASGAWNYGSNALGGLFGGGTAGASIADYTGAAFSNWAAGGSQSLGASQAGYTGAQFSNWTALQNAGNWGMAATSLGAILGGAGGSLYGYGKSGWKGAATGALGGWGGATLGSVGGAALGTAIGGTLGSIVPVIGTSIGAALGSWLGGSLFSGDWQTKDAGLAFSVADGDFLGQQFEYQKKKGGLFGSNKKRFQYSELDTETETQFQATYDATEKSVSELLSKIGVAASEAAFDSVSLAVEHISTQGKTQEEIQAAIADWFGKAGNAMISAVDKGVGGFGYSLEELASRVNVFQTVNRQLEILDKTVLDLSPHSMELANALADVAGGIETLSAGVGLYYQEFFSEAERAQDTLIGVARAFEDAEITLPKTREEFRAIVEYIDITSQHGQELFATLMGLAGQADAYYDILESSAAAALQSAQQYYSLFATESEKAADVISAAAAAFGQLGHTLPASREEYRKLIQTIDVTTEAGSALRQQLMGLASAADNAYRALDAVRAAARQSVEAAQSAVLAAYQRESAELRTVVSGFDALINGLSEFRKSMRGLALDMQAPERQMQALRNQFAQTIEAAVGGDRDALAGIPDAGKALADAALGFASSRVDYLRELAVIEAQTSRAESAAGDQRDVAQEQLDALTEQLDALGIIIDQQETFSEAVVRLLEAQMQAEKDISEAEIAALKGAIGQMIATLSPQLGETGAIAEAVSKSFELIDTSLDKVLSADELKRALVDTGLLTSEKFNSVFAALDRNRDGVVTAIEASSAGLIHALDGYGKFVEQSYQDLFGREADTEGLKYWVDQLRSGVLTLAELQAAMQSGAIGPDKPIQPPATSLEDVVKTAYKSLGLTADSAGVAYWVKQLENGAVTHGNLLTAISNAAKPSQGGGSSGGSTAPVAPSYPTKTTGDGKVLRAYQSTGNAIADAIASAYLGGKYGRVADQAGVDYWYGQVKSGAVTQAQAIAQIQQAKMSPNFWTGGYTGPGGMFEPAGTVHKGEVVFSQADVSRWGGWQAVEQLRKGPQLSISAPSMAPSGAAGVNIVLIEEFRQMRKELEMMRYETKATAINTGRTQDLMRRVTRNGEAMQTEAFDP